MANIGLSQPYYAKYTATNGTVTYTGLAKLGKATTVDVALDNKDPQKLYADNGVAESLWLFSGATVTLGIDELALGVAADILGLTAPGSTEKIAFSVDAVAPYVGLGFIAKKVVGGTIKWRVVTFKKCQFKPVDYSINTQAETVEFQTPELEATVLTPDDASSWQEWGDYNTEAAALTALQTALGT